jgi:CheY-like chemotaxis protein/AraC-like DNA-binding protein
VKDSGRGIPLEDLSKIFDRYFQTSRTDVPLEGGTGIGLSVVKELIELMGGRIKVESSVGKGALFTAVFPVKLPKDTVSGGRASAVSKETKGKTFNNFKKSERVILLVEDNLDFQHYIDFLLNEYYTILVTSNGLEALNLLYEGHLPDLIISDWMMPEMDGFQLAEKIKLEPKLSSIPIVFLTARSMESDMEKAVRLGIDDYLVKPFEEEALFTVVNQLLKRTKSREDASLKQDRIEFNPTDEQGWLETLQKETLDRICNDLFSVDQLASVMLMGRTKFYKEVRRLTGLTPNEYILEARLVRARLLMDTHNDLTLKKVVQMVGLKDEGNFSRAFKKRFGNPPSWYL